MEKQEIINYVMNSPENTNPAILNSMLNLMDGGSGDFGIATVTFVDVSDADQYIIHPLCVDAENGFVMSNRTVSKSEPYVGNVPLYKGKYVCEINEIVSISTLDMAVMPTATGDIVFDLQSGTITITGDGTITAKGVSQN